MKNDVVSVRESLSDVCLVKKVLCSTKRRTERAMNSVIAVRKEPCCRVLTPDEIPDVSQNLMQYSLRK